MSKVAEVVVAATVLALMPLITSSNFWKKLLKVEAVGPEV
jgi:hypothetical protein